MPRPKPIALDHNFPETILNSIERFVPEFAFHWIRNLPGDLDVLEDHDLIYELHRRNFPVMVTNNHRMLDDVRVLVAIEQTRTTVVAIERAGHDPIFATGVLLRDLRDVIKQNTPRGLFVRIRPSHARPVRARDHAVERLGRDWDEEVKTHGRPPSDRIPYPEGNPLRVP